MIAAAQRRELHSAQADELRLMTDAVDAYLAANYDSVVVAASGDGWSSAHWQAMVKRLGIVGTGLAEEFGGLGLSARANAMIMMRFGHALVIEPFLSTAIIGARLLSASPAPVAADLLQGLLGGMVRTAFAHGEGERFDLTSMPKLAATRTGDRYALNGIKTAIVDIGAATHLLVSARDSDGGLLFAVPVDAPGLGLERQRSWSGRTIGHAVFNDVQLGEEQLLLRGAAAEAAIAFAIDEANLMLCAESVGVMERLLADTCDYSRQRVQFGRAIGSFQALQHRMANMFIALSLARSLTWHSIDALAPGGCAKARARAVSAAKARVCASLKLVAREAVQMHGGIGMTDDLAIGRYFKRAFEIERHYGDRTAHLRRFQALSADYASFAEQDDSDDCYAAFRREVRQFFAEELDEEVRSAVFREVGAYVAPGPGSSWKRKLLAKGWAAPGWPPEHGGPGWDAIQRLIYETESGIAEAPMLNPANTGLIGPVIMHFGTEAQKEHFLPRLITNEYFFCQGFSEPGSGSDLASLSTRAERDGDDYIVNGSKIWTTHAQHANWIFLLVRTGREGPRQGGITFLLVPMDTPGITVRPIISMSGEHELNQVFLDNVRVPIANRLGAENDGWSVAKYMLEFERGGLIYSKLAWSSLREARRLARMYPGQTTATMAEDPTFIARSVEIEIALLAINAADEELASSVVVGDRIGDVAAAVQKIASTEIWQDAAELCADAIGTHALFDQRGFLYSGESAAAGGPDHAGRPVAKYMNTLASSIYGGTNEILRNIIAKVELRLPS